MTMFGLSTLFLFTAVSTAISTDTEQDFPLSASDYYAGINAHALDKELQSSLHKLISRHTVLEYQDLWTAFEWLDDICLSSGTTNPTNRIIDMYSEKCWKDSQRCGNYKEEGDCFNREHSWPKSWWGGFSKGRGAETDLFHLYPTDGYVNAQRSDLPFDNVDPTRVKYNSTDGTSIGACQSLAGGLCAEPPLKYKGDFARSYFYVSTAYMNQFNCCDEKGVNGSAIKPWMEKILRVWHNADPVSDKERNRNEIIYKRYQKNRNPFIDHPEWVNQISDF